MPNNEQRIENLERAANAGNGVILVESFLDETDQEAWQRDYGDAPLDVQGRLVVFIQRFTAAPS